MTAEVVFAKGFLASLDSRPVKLQADYAADQKTIQPRGPYTLPRMPHAMEAPEERTAPGAGPTATIHLKSSRNPPVDLKLPALALSTSILELKQKVAVDVGLDGTDKIRLLFNKKPCSDSKSIKDVVGEAGGNAEFSVMFIGAVAGKSSEATAPTDSTLEETPANDAQAMETDEFWVDLESFLEQRLKSQPLARQTAGLFKDTWKEKGKSL